eukprot:11224849-Lingulodinium_polyedra.AAC.1
MTASEKHGRSATPVPAFRTEENAVTPVWRAKYKPTDGAGDWRAAGFNCLTTVARLAHMANRRRARSTQRCDLLLHG